MYLEQINSPQDLKKLTAEQLPLLAEEVRQRIIEVVSCSGGHLASSLGAVELVIALHYCLNAPRDKIVWDVGHQAYAHKILTGRNKQFSTLRQFEGLSGFPSSGESEYDTFISGHSSTAISAGLGLVCSRDYLKPQEQFKVVSVIGDGSLSGGLCFEGLNNAGHLQKDILVILNTNEMSIAPNVGAISTYINKLISLPIYNRFQASLEHFLKSRIPNGGRLLRAVNKLEEGLKGLFIPGMLFEELGFRYFGPLDGHNLNTLIPSLKNILNIKGPRLLHVVTKKGKGYSPAEKEPVRFHGLGPFDKTSGQCVVKETPQPDSYTAVFSRKLIELASQDKTMVAITAAMPEGTGLDRFRDLYPERFFDVGIAEAHAVCFAGGLARGGLRPFVAIYSTFLQRAYDQIIEDVSLQDAGVVFCIDRAGVAGEDGVTHQGIFDIAYLASVPKLTFLAPKDGRELEAMLEFALKINKPCAIRYPRAACPVRELPFSAIEMARPEVLKEGKDFALVALGSMVLPALEAIELLEKEGITGTLINARFVKPMDIEFYRTSLAKTKYVFSVEEGIVNSGFGSLLAQGLDRPVTTMGLPCDFIAHGRRQILLEKYGLDVKGIAGKIKSYICQA